MTELKFIQYYYMRMNSDITERGTTPHFKGSSRILSATGAAEGLK